MSKDTGGPAFPSLNAVCTGLDSDGGERWDTEPSGGMTLRDYFAAKAIAGIIANPDISASAARRKISTEQFRADTVAAAFAVADAMLSERAK